MTVGWGYIRWGQTVIKLKWAPISVDALTFEQCWCERDAREKVCHYPRKKSFNRREEKPTKHHVNIMRKSFSNIVKLVEGFIGTLSMILFFFSLLYCLNTQASNNNEMSWQCNYCFLYVIIFYFYSRWLCSYLIAKQCVFLLMPKTIYIKLNPSWDDLSWSMGFAGYGWWGSREVLWLRFAAAFYLEVWFIISDVLNLIRSVFYSEMKFLS